MSKVPEKQLKQKIYNEKFENMDLNYSLVQKQGSTFGFNTLRLLIFSKNQDQLFYLNKDQKVPFGSLKNYNKGSKYIAKVSNSLFQNPPKTNKVIVKYSRENQKKQKVMTEWIFTMATQGLAQDWVQMLNKYKYEQLKPVKNPQVTGNTVISHLQKQQPEQNEKEEDLAQSFFMKDSKIKYSKEDENKNNPGSSQVKPGNQSQYKSNISQNDPKNKPSDSFLFNNDKPKDSQVKPNSNNQPSDSQFKPSDSQFKPNDSQFKPNDSQVKPNNSYKPNNSNKQYNSPNNQSQYKSASKDWNSRFLQERSLQTIASFEAQCEKLLDKFLKEDRSSDEIIRKYSHQDISVLIADVSSESARQLKREFRNYHYILQASREKQILGVPLCCLIQIYGLVALFKADFPDKVPILANKTDAKFLLQELEQYTKVNNNILFYSDCLLMDLTENYGQSSEKLIYIQNLKDYLPELQNSYAPKQPQGSYLIRSQLMFYNIQKIVTGGSMDTNASNKANQHKLKSRVQLEKILENEIIETADFLSKEEIHITNIFDIKQFLHYRGINMKVLPKVSNYTKNKLVKRFLDTCLVAKIIKDEINIILCNIYSNQRNLSPQKILQGEIRSYIQGKSASNNESWKKVALAFRRKWGFSVNTHQIVGPFFLSCLMTLLPAQYSVQKLNKEKVIFEDSDIIQQGFVRRIIPKSKSYHRFQGRPADKVVEISKYYPENQQTFSQIVQWLDLESQQIPKQYGLNNGMLYVHAYLSDYVPPKKLESKTLPVSSEIYNQDNILKQPPNTPSIKINLNYLEQCLKYKNYDQFRSVVEHSLQIIRYWLGSQHPQISEYYDKISDFEASTGNIDESIKVLEKSLEISKRSEVLNPKKLGKRYYALGSRNLKAGRKKQALVNLQHSRKNLEQSEEDIIEHPLALMKLSSLYLNNGDINKCIDYGKQSLARGQKLKVKDSITIRTYEILSRAFEINGDKDNLRKLSMNCSKKYNSSKQDFVFDQMIKIGLTGCFAKMTPQKAKLLYKLTIMMDQEGKVKSYHESIEQLMNLADQYIVMEKFTIKCELSDRIFMDIQNKRGISAENQQFLNLLSLVTGITTLEFVQGLYNQKQFE